MSTYKILGDDGKEYGPVDAAQIKAWITENRLEKKSPVFPEGAQDWIFLGSLPEFADAFPLQMAAAPTPPPKIATGASGINKLIPYKNPSALVAYYLGVFAVIPLLGIVLGIIAFILGILGLRFRRQHPTAGGSIHAWIGILAGGFFAALWLFAIVAIFVARSHHR